MDTGAFRSSIDWGHELVASTVWVLVTFAIAVPCLIAVLVLIGRMTEWGRQFWRITGPYFTGRPSLVVWAMLALLLITTIVAVRITVLISYYTNDVFTSLQVALQGIATGRSEVTDSGIHGFWVTIGIFLILAVVHVVLNLVDMYVMQRFIMRWRIWLSARVIDDWLGDFAYYRRQFLRRPNDNPDQRIQQDIDIFTTGVGGQTNNPAYGSGNTLLFLDRHRLRTGSHRRRVRHRQAADPVELPQRVTQCRLPVRAGAGEGRQRGDRPLPRRERRTTPVDRAAVGGDGELRQLADPDGPVHRLESDREPGDQSAALCRAGAATVRPRDLLRRRDPVGNRVRHDPQRVVVLPGGLRRVRELPRGRHPSRWADRGERAGPHLQSGGHRRHRRRRLVGRRRRGADPDGRNLVRALDFTLQSGDTLLVSGPSGIGKTVLMQSLAGLWPFVSGSIRLPAGRQAVMFVPQLPYLPLGDLRAVASYPNEEDVTGDREIQHALIKVALPHLAIRLNDVLDWGKVLSVGEQQRIAFARILLSKPRAVFLDESTSAMDQGLELTLYELIRAELPEMILVSVSHRATLEQFHARQLELVGGGQWRLDRITTS